MSGPTPPIKGISLLRDPTRNKGTAFTEAERDALGLRGLLPPRVFTIEEQKQRIWENLRRKTTDLEKYIYLVGLQDRNECLFFRVLIDKLTELMPLIYTPTVGHACREFSDIFTRPRGLYLTDRDRGRVREVLGNWPHDDVRVIVVTDGERILGLGDLGASGMGIPIGKLALYTACAGIPPTSCLPVLLDVGTENARLQKDPLYIGLRQPRTRGPAYDDLVDEFISAVQERYPSALIQLEDFGNSNAFRLLSKHRGQACLFDDDIQGTAAVALSGIYSALRLSGRPLAEQNFLLVGAGEAGIGIGELIVTALGKEGLPEAQARRRCWFVDSRGLIVKSRQDLTEHKRHFAHEGPFIADLLAAVLALRPTVLLGASGRHGIFTKEVLLAMASQNERPVIFALSNPTSQSECSAADAYLHTQGRAIFASGSPFDPVTLDGRTLLPSQANNAYIFPGVGLGVILAQARHVTDEMFFAAAQALASTVTASELGSGLIFPPLHRVREVSAVIAAAVARVAFAQGLARIPEPPPEDLPRLIREFMYEPHYLPAV